METPSSDSSTLNNALVDQLKAAGVISSARVEAAFRAIPRHLFVPGVPLDQVYRDGVIVTKRSATGAPTSSCEQPKIVAAMLEQLDAEPGQHVLEIGAGTGHTAALLARIVGPAGRVTTIDIQPDLVPAAREHLAAAGVPEVNVVCADGGLGYLEAAPYDRILLTVASSDITPAWQAQLRTGGRLVLPLELLPGMQRTVAFDKTPAGLVSLSVKPCGFMPLQGAFAARRPHAVELGPEPGLTLSLGHGGPADPQAVYQLLNGPRRDRTTAVSVQPRELSGLRLWLILKEQGSCGVWVRDKWLDRGVVSPLFGMANQFGGTVGLIDGTQRLALLARPPDMPLASDLRTDERPIRLHVTSCGPDDILSERLLRQVEAWAHHGRPGIEQTRITAYPRDSDYVLTDGEYRLVRPSVQLVLQGMS